MQFAVALALAAATTACAVRVPGPRAPEPYASLVERRERARASRTTGAVLVAAGTVAAAVGLGLMLHGARQRDRELAGDDEAGLGSLLGGVVLGVAGGAVSIGGAVTLVRSTRELRELDAALALLPPCLTACR